MTTTDNMIGVRDCECAEPTLGRYTRGGRRWCYECGGYEIPAPSVTGRESPPVGTFASRNAGALAALGMKPCHREYPKLTVVASRGRYGSVIAESEKHPQNLVRGWLRDNDGVVVSDPVWRVVVCCSCGAPLERDVWHTLRHGVVCEACSYPDDYTRRRWRDCGDCATCGRRVHQAYHEWPGRARRYCQGECAELAALERARVDRAQRQCEGCAEPFIPRRGDSRYCTPACRQKAYRQRTALRVPNEQRRAQFESRNEAAA